MFIERTGAKALENLELENLGFTVQPTVESLLKVQDSVMSRLEDSDVFRRFVNSHSDVIVSEVLKEQTLRRLQAARHHMLSVIDSLKDSLKEASLKIIVSNQPNYRGTSPNPNQPNYRVKPA